MQSRRIEVAARRLDQRRHLCNVEYTQFDALHTACSGRTDQHRAKICAVGELLAYGHNDCETGRFGSMDYESQHVQSGSRRPVQVVDHQHRGGPPRGRGEPLEDGRHGQCPVVVLDRGDKDVTGFRHSLRDQLHKSRAGATEPLLHSRRVQVVEFTTDRLDKRFEGDQRLLAAAAEQDRCTRRACAVHCFEDKGGFAGAGFAHNRDELTATVSGTDHGLVDGDPFGRAVDSDRVVLYRWRGGRHGDPRRVVVAAQYLEIEVLGLRRRRGAQLLGQRLPAPGGRRQRLAPFTQGHVPAHGDPIRVLAEGIDGDDGLGRLRGARILPCPQ